MYNDNPLMKTLVTNYRKRNRIANTLVREFDNPIVGEIQDKEQLAQLFKNFPFVPYAGNDLYSSHSFLYLLLDLVDNNPTLNRCIETIGDYCFNSGQTLYEKQKDLFVQEDRNEATPEIRSRYTEILKQVSYYVYGDKKDFNHFIKALYTDQKNGNAYVKLQRRDIAGDTRYSLYLYPQTWCLYVIPETENETNSVAISRSFDQYYLKKHPPQIIAKYPEATQVDENTQATLFHFKTKSDGVYGRPDWISCLLDSYNDYQNTLYRVKLAGKDFSGSVLIEIENDDPNFDTNIGEEQAQEAGYETTLDQIMDNFTVAGDKATSLMVIERGHGSKEAFVHEFKTNTKEEFYEKIGALNEREIIKANGWSKLLLTGEVPTGFSSTPYIDELKNREISVLRKYQKLMSQMISQIFEPILLDLNEEKLLDYEVDFNLPYTDVIEDEEDDNNSVGSSEIQSSEG